MISQKLTKIFSLVLMFISAGASAQFIGHTGITYVDSSRGNRQIAAEIYYPADSTGDDTQILPGSFPVIVFGHGYVMGWNAYENIWTSLVPEGYIVAFPVTEGGLFPSHNDFALDLKYVLDAIRNTGAGTSIPVSAAGLTSCIMGHSMGGGCALLAAAGNDSLTTVVSFAAANTNPSAVTACQQISVPALIFSGSNDCVAPPAAHQDLMYDSCSASLKTQILISGGGHCYFADNNFNCSLGELTCSPSPSITRAEQHAATEDFLKLWLARFLKNDCSAGTAFQDSLLSSQRITWRQFQGIACLAGGTPEEQYNPATVIYPNPSTGKFTVYSTNKISIVDIYNPANQLICSFDFNSEPEKAEIDLSFLPAGIYFARHKTEVKKLVVNK